MTGPVTNIRSAYPWAGVCPAPDATLGRRFGQAVVRLIDMLAAWQERSAERRHLAGLDAKALKDIGLSRADVAGEAAKPFWIR